ncbi:ras-related protein Rab5 isoform X2 [Drosophila kikkawai]|uniref:Ras-related protein Rab5 isoform X2 n=1 Tax=Drosophila kikkawai TaxID=30033 RepID=A0ABM4G9I0_DROKI
MVAPGYEVIILGNSSVGKSSLLSCYVNGKIPEESQPTVGVEFLVKTIAEPEINAKLKIWDTAGQKRDILRKNYTNFPGALLVYDIHNRDSYDAVQEWTLELTARKVIPRIVIALVGHQADVLEDRVVATEEAERFAKRNGLIFWETSSVTNLNVNRCFMDVAIGIRNARICSCFEALLHKKQSNWYL